MTTFEVTCPVTDDGTPRDAAWDAGNLDLARLSDGGPLPQRSFSFSAVPALTGQTIEEILNSSTAFHSRNFVPTKHFQGVQSTQ